MQSAFTEHGEARHSLTSVHAAVSGLKYWPVGHEVHVTQLPAEFRIWPVAQQEQLVQPDVPSSCTCELSKYGVWSRFPSREDDTMYDDAQYTAELSVVFVMLTLTITLPARTSTMRRFEEVRPALSTPKL